MKKKIAAGIGAVLVTAMCFGSTAFAAGENWSINGKGTDEVTTDGTTGKENTNVTMTYTPTKATDVSWSVTIPREVSFGDVVASTSKPTEQPIHYACTIVNGESATDKVASVTISLSAAEKCAMYPVGDTTKKLEGAFKIKKPDKSDVAAGNEIATLANNTAVDAYAELNKSVVDTAFEANGIYENITTKTAFTGNFSIKLTPNKETTE